MHAIESKLGRDRKVVSGRTGGDLLMALEQRVQKVLKLAENVFNPILDRQEKCDQNRNALSVLQNYEFLFNLPKKLGQSTKLKAWDHVIRDYQKARQLFEVTEVKLFADVEKGIEEIAAQVRETLKKSLCDLPTTVEKQLETVRHLEELGADPGAPGWFCLEQQSELVVRELEQAVETLSSALEATANAAADDAVLIFGGSSGSLPAQGDGSGTTQPNVSQAAAASTRPAQGEAAGGPKQQQQQLEGGTQLMNLHAGAHPAAQHGHAATSLASAAQGAHGGVNNGGSDAWRAQKVFPRLKFAEDISLVLTEHLPQLQQLGEEWATASKYEEPLFRRHFVISLEDPDGVPLHWPFLVKGVQGGYHH